MFVHMSIHTPKPGAEQDLIDSMHRFGKAAAGVPGLIGAHTLRDERTGRLVGLAIWESKEAWEAGVETMRAAVQDDPFEQWEDAPVQGYTLVEA
jgi:heme-degrading monooxygenase HmoA